MAFEWNVRGEKRRTAQGHEAVVSYGTATASPPASPARPVAPVEFERFEDLTRKLVQVPKTEVDEKRS